MFKKMNVIVCLPELNRMPKKKPKNKKQHYMYHPITRMKTFRNLIIN